MSLNSPHGDPNRSLGPSLSYPYIILGAVLSPSPPLAAFSQTGSKAGIAAGSGDRAREQSFSILYPPSCDSMLSKPIYTLVPVFDILVPPKSNARHCRPGSSKVHFNFVDGRESDHDTYLYAILWVGMAPTWSRHAAYGSLTTLTSASEVPRFPFDFHDKITWTMDCQVDWAAGRCLQLSHRGILWQFFQLRDHRACCR